MQALEKPSVQTAAPETITQARTIKFVTLLPCIADQHQNCRRSEIDIELPIRYICNCACHEGATA